jgi:hypothetical protein
VRRPKTLQFSVLAFQSTAFGNVISTNRKLSGNMIFANEKLFFVSIAATYVTEIDLINSASVIRRLTSIYGFLWRR